jgi:hypothetical protein
MVQFEYKGVTQSGEVLEVKTNGDRTLKLDDGSIVSIARRNWKPLQAVATLEPTLSVPKLDSTSDSSDAASDSQEPIAKTAAPNKLPVDTWMKAALVAVAAAIILND